MSGISFFTALEFQGLASFGEKATEWVDGYFYLGGAVAVVCNRQNIYGNPEAALRMRDAVWWKTALKVISYATVILPTIMLIAKGILRSIYRFDKEREYLLPKAPLTFVRGEGEMEISVLFDEQMVPQEPIFPKPDAISSEGKHTWKVLSHGDGTMTVREEEIRMIWWEAMRKGEITPLDLSKSVCIMKEDFRNFLSDVLERMGLRQSERTAFVEYWEKTLKPSKSFFLMIQPIEPQDQHKYIPRMEVSRPDFPLSRIYFRFEPTDEMKGMDPEAYFQQLEHKDLGRNVVIDLGAEVLGDLNKPSDEEFNQEFIRRHVRV